MKYAVKLFHMMFQSASPVTTVLLTWSISFSMATTNMFPLAPLLGQLRLANISDIPRIAVVATAGFYYSPVFAWERPFHHSHPLETFRSYEKMFAEAIRSLDYIALVAEDEFEIDEINKTEASIQPGNDYTAPKPSAKAIVGVATWKLEDESHRKGQYMDKDDEASPNKRIFDGGSNRDKSDYHAKLLVGKCEAAEQK